ncbi:unnamed protein product [Owenia fusiformis]|uniref:Fucosyltransferase n=1 Tax=Owenia fusiformis TaxID=6347 RepID=A0A8S4NHI6_OWEFU|nr:unnamed protein product [Owenia fusiformis]
MTETQSGGNLMKAIYNVRGRCASFPCCRRVCFLVVILLMVLVTTIYYITTDSYAIPHLKKRNFLNKSAFTRMYSIGGNATNNTENPKVVGTKLVVLWFPFFSEEPYLWTLSKGSLDNCPVTNCVSTFDKSKLLESAAVVIHVSDPHIDQLHPVLPGERHHHQRWVLFTMEPPQNMRTDLSSYNNIFNWTATFRTDSDIPVYYGRKVEHNNTNLELIYKNQTILDKEKPRLVAWVASNPLAHSNRMRLVRELQSHMEVDVYGGVSQLYKHNDLSCVKNTEKCDHLLRQYKFYLALENNNCRDYITEKFWYALERGNIPVVTGGDWFKKQAPPFSYIDTRSFSSTKSLAKYLIRVANDVDLFNKYMQWRHSYRIVDTNTHTGVLRQWGCDLCKALNNPALPAQVYSDLPGWYAEDLSGCSTYSFWGHLKKTINMLFFRLGA